MCKTNKKHYVRSKIQMDTLLCLTIILQKHDNVHTTQ
jgi:hypothetical protein